VNAMGSEGEKKGGKERNLRAKEENFEPKDRLVDSMKKLQNKRWNDRRLLRQHHSRKGKFHCWKREEGFERKRSKGIPEVPTYRVFAERDAGILSCSLLKSGICR